MPQPDDLDPKTVAVIAFKARWLSPSPEFLPRDEEDLRQELAMHVVDLAERVEALERPMPMLPAPPPTEDDEGAEIRY